MKAVGTLFLLIITATCAIANISVTKTQELLILDSIDTRGNMLLTDVNADGYLDILFDSPTKIGWYSIQDEVMKFSITKLYDYYNDRAYVLGFFDNDQKPDCVEIIIEKTSNSERYLFAVYRLSSSEYSQTDTVVLAQVNRSDTLHVATPTVYDRNGDGIDELYTGYFYYNDPCDTASCTHNDPVKYKYSYQYADEEIGRETAPPMSYQSFELEGFTNPLNLVIRNPFDYGGVITKYLWESWPLEITTMNESLTHSTTLITANELCNGPTLPPNWYIQSSKVTLMSYCLFDPQQGLNKPRLLAQVYKEAYRMMTWAPDDMCDDNEVRLFEFDLASSGSLRIKWQATRPFWATSEIIFADPRSPDHIILSDNTRLYLVQPNFLGRVENSNSADLAGHMLGYRALSNGETPSLVLLDKTRERTLLKVFRVDFDNVTDVDDNSNQLPDNFTLSQNYPNPFNPTTEISYSISIGSNVTLTIFNSLGQEVSVLVDEFVTAGTHTVSWNGTDISGNPVASGIYLYRLTTGDNSKSMKMLLLK